MIKNANRVALVLLVCVLAVAGPHEQKTQAQSAPLRWDGTMEDVARRDPNWTPPFVGRPHVSRHAVTEDGRRIVFQQIVQNGPDSHLYMLLWHDRENNQTSAFLGAQIISRPVISADGNDIAFESCDESLRPDHQAVCDLYVAHTQNWSLTSMTTREDGTEALGGTTDPMLSATGRFLVFSSGAPGLLPPGAAEGQIVWRDRDPDEDGIYDEPGEVLVRVVSVSSSGVAGNGASELPQVSRDGRFIAFKSRASNLVEGDDDGEMDLFLHDRQTGETRRINVASPLQSPSVTLDHFSMTENGSLIAFGTNHEGIGTDPTYASDTNGTFDVVVYDREAGSWSRVNIGAGGAPGNGATDTPTFSADGRYVVVRSTSTNVNGAVTPGRSHIYAHDRQTGQTTQISVATNGAEANADASEPLISGDGSVVLFLSPATNLVSGIDETRPTLFAASHFGVTPGELSITTRGNEVTAQVSAQRYVKWASYNMSNWLWSLSDIQGQGNGTLQFSANANTSPEARTVSVDVYRSLGQSAWNATGTPKSIVVTQAPGISASGMSPTSGSMSGGTLVTITGTSFEPDMTAHVDGYQATLQYVDSTTVRVTTPASTRRGEVMIWLQTSDYRYAPVPGMFRYVDTTPPNIFPYAFGPQTNGWFTGDVQVMFNIEDGESDIIAWTPQCFFQEVQTDTPGTTFTCTATTEGGTSTASITVRRDTTWPVVRLTTPQTTIYPRGSTIAIDYSCEDATSSISQCEAPLPNGVPLPTSAPGFYSFWVTGEDGAGHVFQQAAWYAVSSGQCEARPAGLVAWWPWDEAGQPSFRDTVSGTLATGVNLAPSFGTGFIGPLAPSMIGEVYGQDSYVNAGTRADLQMSNAFTLAAWVYRAPTETMETRIIAGREGEYLLGHDPMGNVIFSVAHPALGWNFRYANLPPLPVGQWAHVAMTYDGTTLRLFVNGLSGDWSRWTLGGPIGDAMPELNEFRIGSRQGLGGDNYGLSFLGRIDDVHVLNRGMSEDEIQRMFLAGDLGLCAARTPTMVVTPSSVPVTFGQSTTAEIVASVRDGEVPLSGRTVSVFQHGSLLGSGVTDASGEARVSVTVNGDAPETGDHTLEVRHTADYLYEAGGSRLVPVTVNPVTPLITWNAPASITYGTPLGAAQLSARANTDGTFDYTPPAGTALGAGTYTLDVAFTPSDSQHYTTAAASVSLLVTKATPTVSVTGGTFTYDGQPHAATGSITGVGGAGLGTPTFTYNGSTTVPVNAGTYAVVASFAGDANYEAASATATLTIGKATPTLSATGGTFTYDGQPHAAAGTVTGVGGAALNPLTFTYNGGTGVPVNAGTYAVVASFAGDANYEAASATATLTIGKATPTVSANGGTFTYDGQPHAASGSVTGVGGAGLGAPTFTYNGSPEVPVNAGSYAVVASFAGDANYEAASATATLTIGKATPTVSAAGGTFTYDGQPHAAAGTVTGVGGAGLGAPTFTYNGSSEVPVNAGSYAVVASFAGDANYEAASATATLTVGKAAATVNATGGTFTYDGQPHAASGSVTGIPGTAPGPLTFTYNGSSSVPVGAGSYDVVATFAGDANYEPASASTTIAINRAPLTIRANDATKRFGAPLPAFSAAATGFVPGETLASLSGSLALATTATQQSAVGTYAIAASGLSSPNYTIAFVSGTLTITRGTVAVAVSSSPQPSGLDMPMTFAAVVTAAEAIGVAPTGTVQFFTGGTLIGSASLSGQSASISTAGLAAGTHAIEARYLGDGSFDVGLAAGSHTVRDASGTPAISVTSSRNPANLGQSVTLTANIAMASGPVSGAIQFYDGVTLIGSGTISAGRATLTTSVLPAGSHAIVARFAGNASAPPATSPVFVQSVGASGWKDRATTMALSTPPEPSIVGGPVTIMATVSGSSGAPTGRILILVDGQAVGDPAGIAVTPVSGSAASVSVVLPSLNLGRHTISATYLGDSTYKGSTAQAAHQVQ